MLITIAAVAIVGLVTAWSIIAFGSTQEKPRMTPSPSAGASQKPTQTPTPAPTPTPTPPGFDKTARSIDDPASIWVVVNKLRPLNPPSYAPADLVDAPVAYANSPLMRSEAAAAVVAMFSAANAEGAGGMRLQSAYRSYNTQVNTYQYYVNTLGQAQADIASARAGHSEHQTGLTADISTGNSCILQECFAATPQGGWLVGNAHRFGFMLRYPNGLTPITGFAFEPWHYRYVGVDLATEMHTKGIATLEEFFGLPAAPSYAG